MKTNEELAQVANTTVAALEAVAKLIPSINIDFMSPEGRVEETQAKIVLAYAFIRLAKSPQYAAVFPLLRYANANQLKYIGIRSELTINKSYLIPSFNGQSYPEVKCEFTTIVHEHMQVHVPTINREAFVLRQSLAKAKTTMEAIRLLLEHGKLYIGSVGSRKTNSGTDYQIIFDCDVLTQDAKDIIDRFVDVKNDQNTMRQYGFILTHLEEVVQFMDAISCKAWLEQQIAAIKQFEYEHRLRDIYEANDGCIPNYKEATKSIEIRLDSLLQAA